MVVNSAIGTALQAYTGSTKKIETFSHQTAWLFAQTTHVDST